ncbi:MAG TPA: hypothetical protein VGK95_09210 [Caldimonas sp.]
MTHGSTLELERSRPGRPERRKRPSSSPLCTASFGAWHDAKCAAPVQPMT